MIIFENLGLIDFKDAWNYQKKIFREILSQKENNEKIDKIKNKVLLCEHPHVYTLGKNGNNSNLLINLDVLKQINAQFYHIDRGGDITYHGPGQLVGYPILNLEFFKIGIKKYIYLLEESIINTLKHFNIKAERLQGAPGVWIEPHNEKARKICAIGVKVSHFITMHGFALNVNTNLEYFKYINPCGFIDKNVTSVEKELKTKIDFTYVINIFEKEFRKIFESLDSKS